MKGSLTKGISIYIVKDLSLDFQKNTTVFTTTTKIVFSWHLKICPEEDLVGTCPGALLVKIVTEDCLPCISKCDFWIPRPQKLTWYIIQGYWVNISLTD